MSIERDVKTATRLNSRRHEPPREEEERAMLELGIVESRTDIAFNPVS
ncbi:hypothetical protein GCM10010987_79900 [Bradyrhizobium guangdongense]|uniref:Uncharacterized protein n=1 Tax=Bradyrhizobium guangdongense TaxID=1325090 RepID=A0AA87WGK4_9BRAD|nr:hypothetical protein GCM10010987_79900 [Bradyrhizobium guangdongense]